MKLFVSLKNLHDTEYMYNKKQQTNMQRNVEFIHGTPCIKPVLEYSDSAFLDTQKEHDMVFLDFVW